MAAKRNNKGQSFIEFIFFLPIMLTFLALLINFGNSINGAINQQKITRSYFFSRIKNDSNLPQRDLLGQTSQGAWRLFGMHFIGWRERFESGDFPVQPCYKLRIPVKGEQKCQTYEGDSTDFIRVGTVFGMCGATYVNAPAGISKSPAYVSGGTHQFFDYSSRSLGCTIIE